MRVGVPVTRHAARSLLVALLGGVLLAACAETEKGISHPVDRLHFPTTLAADPEGRFLYVVSSNFDVRYRSGAVVAIDLTTHRLLPDTAVGIGHFGGELTLRAVADEAFAEDVPGGDRYRLVGYVTSRAGREVHWFTVADDEDGTPLVDCGEDPGAADDDEVRECDDDHSIGSAERKRLPRDDADLTPEEIADADGGVDMSLGLDVYGTAVYPGEGGLSDYLLVTNPRSGELAVFHIDGGYPMKADEPGQPAGDPPADSVPSKPGEPVYLEDLFIGGGAYAVAVTPQGDRAYATSRFANAVLPFRIDEIPDPAGTDRRWPVVADLVAVPINNTTIIGDYGRELVFNSEGTRAYLAYHNPSAIVLFDTTPDEEGARANRFIDAVDVGLQPSALALAPGGPDGADRLYVVCFRDEALWVIDPELLEVEARIELPGGPFDLVVVPDPTTGALRAYVTMFERDAVAVIELDRESPFFQQVIAYIRGVDDDGAHQ